MISHLLNRTLTVFRPQTVDDGSGGQTVTLVQVGTVRAQVNQPSAAERQTAAQWGSEHTHTIHTPAGADVARGDELRGDGQTFRVISTVTNSRTTYTRAEAELIQLEGEP